MTDAASNSLPWGIFATIGSAYASEICPLAFRPYLTAYTNMVCHSLLTVITWPGLLNNIQCFAIGQFIGAGVLQGTINLDNEWSYRIPFAVQWVWPMPLMVAAYYMPESPVRPFLICPQSRAKQVQWFLVRNNKLDEAEHNLRRVMAESEKSKANDVVAMMVHTNEIEQETVKGTSYIDCYRGTDWRRTEIACMTFSGQVLSGSEFAYSGTYVRHIHGSPDAQAWMANVLLVLPASRHVSRRRVQARTGRNRHCFPRHHHRVVLDAARGETPHVHGRSHQHVLLLADDRLVESAAATRQPRLGAVGSVYCLAVLVLAECRSYW